MQEWTKLDLKVLASAGYTSIVVVCRLRRARAPHSLQSQSSKSRAKWRDMLPSCSASSDAESVSRNAQKAWRHAETGNTDKQAVYIFIGCIILGEHWGRLCGLFERISSLLDRANGMHMIGGVKGRNELMLIIPLLTLRT